MAVSTRSYLCAFTSRAECDAAKPSTAGGTYKVHAVVAPDGSTYFTWSTSGNSAVGQVARDVGGWSVSLATNDKTADIAAANARAAAAQAELDELRARIKAAGLDAELG